MKPTLYRRIREILDAARVGVARSVNTTQVVANWLIGREIVEDEQKGKRRAGYGERLLSDLSRRLQADFGGGYSVDNLEWFRQFYLVYPQLLGAGKSDALRRISGDPAISDAVRRKSTTLALQPKSLTPEQKSHALRGESSQPGQLHLNLAWTHYRTLLRVEKPEARSFYEIEALQNNWSARELKRQINSLLYERLALSRDKNGLLRLARKGQEIQGPLDVFKDPLVLEFLKIPAAAKLVESDLEAALLNELQSFLLELGNPPFNMSDWGGENLRQDVRWKFGMPLATPSCSVVTRT